MGPHDLGVVVRQALRRHEGPDRRHDGRPLRARRARARLGRARGRPGDERLERARLARESRTPRKHRGVMETLATTGTPEPPGGSDGKGAVTVEFMMQNAGRRISNVWTSPSDLK